MELPKKYFNLKKGTKIKINGKDYVIKEKIVHKTSRGREIISYGLEDNYFLDYDDYDWSFFMLETKKGFFDFETTRSKIIKVGGIEIIS